MTVRLMIMFALCAIVSANELQWSDPENNGRNSALPAENLPGRIGKENLVWKVDMTAKWNFARPTVKDGKIVIGTHINALRDEDIKKSCTRKAGAMICLDAKTGQTVWELGIAERGPGGYGFVSSPLIDGDRLYMKGQDVYCIDMNGQADGNDGFQDEIALMTKRDHKGNIKGEPLKELKPTHGDIIWRCDLSKLRAQHHDASAGTILMDDDLLWVTTSHALGKKPAPARMNKPEDAEKYRYRKAPNVVVVDKNTGDLIATDDLEIERVFHGQWSSVSTGKVNGKDLFFWGDGYGILHAFERPARSEDGSIQTLKQVWQIDCNPPEYRVDENGNEIGFPIHGKNPRPKDAVGPTHIIGVPVFHNGLLYLAMGRDRAYNGKAHEPGQGNGRILCIDPSKPEIVWENRDLGRTQSTVSIGDDLIYVADMSKYMHCFDLKTGEKVWQQDLNHLVECQSQLLADNKLYVANKKGEFFILQAGREAKVLSMTDLGNSICAPVTAVNGILYVCTQDGVSAYKGSMELAQ